MLKGNIATSPEAQDAAAEEGRKYGVLIASAIIETYGADLPENRADQLVLIQPALESYLEILRDSGIHSDLSLIAAKNAAEACSTRFLDIANFLRMQAPENGEAGIKWQ